jgi:hypothetical protein
MPYSSACLPSLELTVTFCCKSYGHHASRGHQYLHFQCCVNNNTNTTVAHTWELEAIPAASTVLIWNFMRFYSIFRNALRFFEYYFADRERTTVRPHVLAAGFRAIGNDRSESDICNLVRRHRRDCELYKKLILLSRITNMATVRKFVNTSKKCNIIRICSSGNCVQNWSTELCNNYCRLILTSPYRMLHVK